MAAHGAKRTIILLSKILGGLPWSDVIQTSTVVMNTRRNNARRLPSQEAVRFVVGPIALADRLHVKTHLDPWRRTPARRQDEFWA
jgi:predicted ATPase